jgi:hypothetical protein
MGGTFEPSLELNAAFYREVVEPLVRHVPHAAALLGWGSDVFGYDTARSTDHGWGPRLQVFVDAHAVGDVRAAIEEGYQNGSEGGPSGTPWAPTRVTIPPSIASTSRRSAGG